jgi:very-short-patch-repair endonuclease
VRNGHLHRLHRGIYAVGHPNVPLEGRFLAAVKACGPTAVLSHFSAAALWDLIPWDGDRLPQVTVQTTSTRTHRYIKVHRTRTLIETTRRHGIPVTTPERTLIDLSSMLPYKPLRRALREALADKRTTLTQLLRATDRSSTRPKTLIEVIATAAPTRSELEDAVLDLVLSAGFRRPDVNRPLTVDGRRLVPDLRWPTERLIVEADGARFHENPIARHDDLVRQALLEATGERLVRVTWEQATRHRRRTLARLEAAGAPKPHAK